MRRPRLIAPSSHPVAYYHCVSRVVNRALVLGNEEKEKLVEFMRTYERLYELRVIAYCMMSNHFHIMVEVPQRPAEGDLPDDAGLVAKVKDCLGEKIAAGLEWELARFREVGAAEAAEVLRESWFSRMWNVSAFMKVLKQRFSQWFNGRHARRGTLWEDRFRSVLVEGRGNALRAMAAYIDLNPVRAGICEDPKDYRWCGYAAAVAGVPLAREALRWLAAVNPHGGMMAEIPKVAEALRLWRCLLFGVPKNEARQEEEIAKGTNAELFRSRLSRGKALDVLAEGGRLPQSEYLRCKVRYFTDGAVLGGKNFVEEIFLAFRERFGARRKSGARPVRGIEARNSAERLFNLRQLRKDVFA